MIFWYKNSVLASVLSIFGCAAILVAVRELIAGEIGVEAVPMILIGLVLAIAGKKVSDHKANKK